MRTRNAQRSRRPANSFPAPDADPQFGADDASDDPWDAAWDDDDTDGEDWDDDAWEDSDWEADEGEVIADLLGRREGAPRRGRGRA